MRQLLILFLFISQILSAQVERKKPEEVFDLYFRAFVKGDQESFSSLNIYLAPLFSGHNVYDFDMKKKNEQEISGMTNTFLPIFSPSAGKSNKQNIEDYFATMLEYSCNSKYEIKSLNVFNFDELKKYKGLKLSYNIILELPEKSIQEIFTSYVAQSNKKLTSLNAKEVETLITELKKEFTKKGVERTIDSEGVLLIITMNGKEYYYMPEPQNILSPDALAESYFGHY
ncbi:hypothetical protein [Elizabethkingia anophelis]|uniref:hypothetical protein n=1 Tax=Elizabethkingia anophelis TaxID=1117645 RepID=UPI00373008CB